MNWENLAPDIHRQRMVLEGVLLEPFNPVDMVNYCNGISRVLNMTPVGKPKTDFAEDYGWCCFMHWKESGMHIYGWDRRHPPFFSIDIYTCKEFKYEKAVEYTEDFLGKNLIKLVWKE